jgi:hypothetical protein
MSAGGSIGMVLDRALTTELLDVALRVATEHRNDPAVRHLLTIALRDHVTRQEAENKTRKILTRVWVAPPADSRSMIEWAILHQDEFLDRRALHYGAMLATFPFFGSIASAVGRQIRIDGGADRTSVRAHARTTFGEREFIDAGASKCLRTLRLLGMLDGPNSGPLRIAEPGRVPAELTSWFLHALMLTRQVESVGIDELTRAPELAFLSLDPAPSTYPLLELHAENGRTVAIARDVSAPRCRERRSGANQ